MNTVQTTGGRRYEPAEWVEFLHGLDELDDETVAAREAFSDRVLQLADGHLENTDTTFDLENTAYLTFASLAGHGIGLWEGDEPWHVAFEEVAAADEQLRRLHNDLAELAYHPDAD